MTLTLAILPPLGNLTAYNYSSTNDTMYPNLFEGGNFTF